MNGSWDQNHCAYVMTYIDRVLDQREITRLDAKNILMECGELRLRLQRGSFEEIRSWEYSHGIKAGMVFRSGNAAGSSYNIEQNIQQRETAARGVLDVRPKRVVRRRRVA